MPPPAPFHSTLWSVVLQARDGDGSIRRRALDRLCTQYWAPIYAYLQRRGLSREDAQDATQGFFAYFLEKNLVEDADRGRGRFRRYLLAVLEHWMANERRTATTQKRGGGVATLSLDFAGADRTMPIDATQTPDATYRRVWALSIMREAMSRLRREYDDLGRRRRFEAVASHLAAAGPRPGTDELAARLGVTAADVRHMVHDARVRLREIIRSILRETVETEREVDEEVTELFASV